ncbi:MAG: hypothetical protein LM580_02630 [Thermofilum sp.]|jgi:translation initiation factor 2B subunit (eIF-2B alpha/beta/delta family)|nr:hypothetical protein [Thermofilum sp.]
MPGVLEELLSSVGGFKIYSSTDVALAVADAVVKCFSEAEDLLEAARSVLALVEGLARARPTSVISLNVARRLVEKAEALVKAGEPRERVAEALAAESSALKRELESSIAVAAALGARRVRDGSTLMTCSYSKSVKALFSRLKSEGKRVRAIVAESRPGGEGVAMAEEISDMGFETELVVDSAVRFFMKDVDAVVVGAEAIAANGAVINKVGTSLIALAAHEARVRTFVIATTHKFSTETVFGELVKLPVVEGTALLPGLERAKGVTAKCPLFDVTPPRYIDAIVTEKGVVAPEAALLLVKEVYGWPSAPDAVSCARRLVEVVERARAS